MQGVPNGKSAGAAAANGGASGNDALTKQQLEETMKQMMAPQSGLNADESALDRWAPPVQARKGALDYTSAAVSCSWLGKDFGKAPICVCVVLLFAWKAVSVCWEQTADGR